MHGQEVEFADVCRFYLGSKSYYIAAAFSVLSLLGVSMVYWVRDNPPAPDLFSFLLLSLLVLLHFLSLPFFSFLFLSLLFSFFLFFLSLSSSSFLFFFRPFSSFSPFGSFALNSFVSCLALFLSHFILFFSLSFSVFLSLRLPLHGNHLPHSHPLLRILF